MYVSKVKPQVSGHIVAWRTNSPNLPYEIAQWPAIRFDAGEVLTIGLPSREYGQVDPSTLRVIAVLGDTGQAYNIFLPFPPFVALDL